MPIPSAREQTTDSSPDSLTITRLSVNTPSKSRRTRRTDRSDSNKLGEIASVDELCSGLTRTTRPLTQGARLQPSPTTTVRLRWQLESEFARSASGTLG